MQSLQDTILVRPEFLKLLLEELLFLIRDGFLAEDQHVTDIICMDLYNVRTLVGNQEQPAYPLLQILEDLLPFTLDKL